MPAPKFASISPSFHTELKKRIAEYFAQTGKEPTGNGKLWSKALILLTAYIFIYLHLVFFTPESNLLAIAECALLGGVMASIGFNIMHDGSHGSFSNNPAINKLAATTLGLLGGSPFMWSMKHNVIHHAYTNIDGVDDDIDARPFLRMAETQKRYRMHKYQHIYFWFLYSFLHIFWMFFTDYKKYFRGRIGDIPLKKMSIKDHFFFWFYKIVCYSLFIVVPMFTVGVLPALIGFFTMTLVCGFIISIIFQLAHTVEHTHFPHPAEDGRMPDEWAVHQLKTTANFATKSKLISWLVGGLNFQVEHHLFPKISHIHYPAISKIVKQACSEYGVVYIEYPKMYQAIASHVAFLKQMGKA